MNGYTNYAVDRMDEIQSSPESAALSETCVNYKLLDVTGKKIGRVRELYVNSRGQPEYVRAKLPLLSGMRSVMLPVAAAGVDEVKQTLTLQ